jgi:hypothetical protein
MNLETTITSHQKKYPGKTFNYKLHPKYSKILKGLSNNVVCSLVHTHKKQL